MPRRPRVLIEGGLYHVFNRVSRGLQPFKEKANIKILLDYILQTKVRDSMTIYAWCLLPDAYHLAIRTGQVSLSRSMRTIQHRFAQSYNRKHADLGPFWQGRYKTVLMPDQDDFTQLLAYIHRRPVEVGLAERPVDYLFSGHREITGKRKPSLIDVGEVLAAFVRDSGDTRAARRRYNKLLADAASLDWMSCEPGWLPWWRVGRPAAPQDIAVSSERAHPGPQVRGDDVYLLVELCADLLQVPRELLESRLKSREIVKARELLAVVAVERYGVRVKDLATVLNKAPESVSRWVSLTLRRRIDDLVLRQEIDDLASKIGSSLES